MRERILVKPESRLTGSGRELYSLDLRATFMTRHSSASGLNDLGMKAKSPDNRSTTSEWLKLNASMIPSVGSASATIGS